MSPQSQDSRLVRGARAGAAPLGSGGVGTSGAGALYRVVLSNVHATRAQAGGYAGRVASSDGPTPEERATGDLVKAVRETGNLRPLVAVLRDPDGGPERARDALLLLGELDVELLVQVALDTLIDDYVDDPALAVQTRREIRGADAGGTAS